ncbi:hypothetical protein JMJ35_008069 [Cladonia borealis]|uniref:BD-FAE-like domain-containing protein n=1 Tax=Cladonia borealis TaxID=184061 RepID=A0AA39QX32_9LECA|nr:hypothetical protein JMJ35_008069 [Cladonia borealis]
MSTTNPPTLAPLYTSHLSIPYSPLSPLNTLDIHHLTPTPTNPLLSPSYTLLYIHGGAFRDPLVTSLSIIPSFPAIFSTGHIATIASINYRLSPYPHHPTHPSHPGDKSRNAKWPDHINDVRDAIKYLQRPGGELEEGKEWIICGHSVGATMALMLAMSPSPSLPSPSTHNHDEYGWGHEIPLPGLIGVIGISGIYDFTACRDAHPAMRDIYDAFITGAFGPEEDGGWERGDVRSAGRRVGREVGVVVVGGSRGDELVEWEQVGAMMGGLEWEEGEGRKVVVEVEGGHMDVVEGGVGVGMCVGRCLEALVGMEEGRGDGL